MTITHTYYGECLFRAYRIRTGMEAPPILTTRSLQGLQIVALHAVVDREQFGLTERIPPEDTFIVGFSPTGVPHHELWSKGRLVKKGRLVPNSMRIGNLSDEYQERISQPYENVCFLIRRAALDAFTSEEGYHSVQNLSCRYGIVDSTIMYLTRTLLPLFARPQEASAIFVDHVELAITAYLVDRYSDNQYSSAKMARGGLTPVQTRRAQEMLASNLKGNLNGADIAKECGISRSHLISAFKKTTGYTPHQWLQWRRIDQAEDMLKNTKLPIGDIALQCGFTDQSHLTKTFTTMVQTTPAVWRRQNQSHFD